MEIRIYDLSETLELINKQLSNNQIKDIVSQSYHLSQQLKSIYDDCKLPALFNIQRKFQVNFVLITNILTDRIEKKNIT